MAKHGKKYRAAAAKVDRNTFYTPSDALKLAVETSTTNFDSTVEVHVRMGLDPRKADQQVRDVVNLPHGLGKNVRVLVFASGEGATIARDAGADFVAEDDEAMKKIQGGWTDFDVAVATPDMMRVVGKLGKVLGPRGLMPNPKTGTVTMDVTKAIKEVKAGRIEFRVDRQSNVAVSIGKVSFDENKIIDNTNAFIEAVMRAKPSAAKGAYFLGASICSTMGPGIKLDYAEMLAALKK